MNNILIEDTTNFFKSISGDQEFTGLNLIVGSYSIHLLEAESPVINKMLHSLNEYSH